MDQLSSNNIVYTYNTSGSKDLIKDLEQQLKENIEKEDYKQAAIIASKIKELKNSKLISSKIAGKFSAKEAASKALGTGFADGVKHKDIEILNLESGKPIINLHSNAKQKLNNIQSSSISISNEDGFVITIVTFLVKNQ